MMMKWTMPWELWTPMLEPIMIVFLAVVVGGIVFAMFLPLLQVIERWGNPSSRIR